MPEQNNKADKTSAAPSAPAQSAKPETKPPAAKPPEPTKSDRNAEPGISVSRIVNESAAFTGHSRAIASAVFKDVDPNEKITPTDAKAAITKWLDQPAEQDQE